ncbi:hypothetical protein [Actinokineospora fastidiosa]|uniref:Uncharacterized protein n=1 Tax=Actinokineospora fastidiosa TaxID=1816 RepID=A0A918GCC9_9PSEU|nr:hypothetical protein [Actinokineospora fastidiosa]GGS28206.1 hypothetical protein GCM10010171_21400 [Actinokineospora fastidiosa]
MAIDPMHLPIFGDPRPVQPPAAVRAAAVLLLVQAALTVAVAVHAGADPTFFAIAVLLTMAFTHALRAGRDWARPAVGASAFASLFLSIAVIDGVVVLALVGVSGALLASSLRLMFRAEVQGYFLSSDVD